MHEIDTTASITEQASAWWMLLNHGDATAADTRAFGEWVARSPERVEAFLQTARLSRALQTPDLKWPNTPADALIRAAKSASAEIIDLTAQGRRRSPMEFRAALSARWITFSRAAVVSMAVLVIGAVGWHFVSRERYETAIGEQRSVVLSDGSVVTLNTASTIEVRMANDRRTVELLSGEALFQVVHDPVRPFDVDAGTTTVRAIGTQFNVDRRPGSTTVTVVEGKVAVSTGNDVRAGEVATLPVAAGEQLVVAASAKSHAAPANIASATAWTQRRLVFDHRPLGEVAQEFNRYNREQIEIQSAQLRREVITGVFEANNPESFMTFLEKIPDVNVERSAVGRRLIVTQSDPTPGNR